MIEKAARDFIANATWLGPEHGLGGILLVEACRRLDEEFTPALVSQVGLMYRFLVNLKPAGVEFDDPLENLLRR